MSLAVAPDVEEPRSPDGTAGAERVRRPPLWAEVLALVWLLWLYDLVNNLSPLRLHAALLHAQGILHLERTLSLDPEVALNAWVGAHRTLGFVLSNFYDDAHFVVTLSVLGWLWW